MKLSAKNLRAALGERPIRKFAAVLVACASLIAVSCLQDHPIVSTENVTDAKSTVSRDTSLRNLDTVQVQLRDAKDSTRIIKLWTGPIDSLSKIPLYLGGDGEDFIIVIRGRKKATGFCYTKVYMDDQTTIVTDSCTTIIPTKPGPIRITDTRSARDSIAVGDSLLVNAHVEKAGGHLKSYAWDFNMDGVWDDTGSMHGDSADIIGSTSGYSKAGKYWIRLRVMDDSGGIALDSVLITVGNRPAPGTLTAHFVLRADTVISIEDSVAYLAHAEIPGGTLKSFLWDYDGDGVWDESGFLSGSSSDIRGGKRFGTKPGTYAGNLRVTEDNGTSTTLTMHTTVLLDAPYVNAGVDTTVLQGTLHTLKGKAVDSMGYIVSTQWFLLPSPTPIGTTSLLSRTESTVGVQTYVFQATDDDGLQRSDTVLINVVAPALDSNDDLSALSLSDGTLSPVFFPWELAFTASVANATSAIRLIPTAASAYASITVNGTTTASGTSSQLIPLAVGTNTINVIVTAQNGNRKTYQIAVTRAGQPTATTQMGYAWVGNGTGASATITNYVYNSTGQPVVFSRQNTGKYQVTFQALGGTATGSAGNGGHVQVTAYGSVAAHCTVESWGGTDFLVNVDCAGANGSPMDAGFTVLVTFPRNASSGANGFLWTDNVDSSSTPSSGYSYNSAGGSIAFKKTGVGAFESVFSGLKGAQSVLGNAMVTLYGLDTGWCNLTGLTTQGSDVKIQTACFSGAGSPTNYRFSLSEVFPLTAGQDFGLGYAVAPGPQNFADTLPNPATAYSSGGGTVKAHRTGLGNFTVTFPGLGGGDGIRAGNVQVTAYGAGNSGFCQVQSWDYANAIAGVSCFSATGTPTDSYFNIWYVK